MCLGRISGKNDPVVIFIRFTCLLMISSFLFFLYTVASVSKVATSTIEQYVSRMGFGDTSSMVSTIIEMVEKLPILAQGGKKTEIRMQVQLITGYLSSLGSKGASGLATSSTLKRCLIRK